MMLRLTTAIAASAIGLAQAAYASTDYPITLTNCGIDISVVSAPERTVTVGQSATEILYSLGLADRINGTSVWFNPVLPQFSDANEAIERIANDDPSFEAVVNKRPDLVAVQYEWHVGPNGSVATREQFHELGINTYIMPADCDTKDNSTGGDGTRTAAFSTDSIYKGITELADIYDVQDAGEALITDLAAREQRAIDLASSLDLPEDLSAAFWFSSTDLGVSPFVAGQLGAPGYMMEKLDIRNVIESDEEWPTVGWESIARADPDVLVIANMDRRRFPADNIEAKREFLRSDPVTREMNAVKNNRIVEMDAHAMSATMRTIYGLETLAESLSNMSFNE
ncbi:MULTISPECIES: ABC transporter substrate-binding protein [Halomonadaceae]|uniref:ABC transporter substrate-binding protein n=1 Tax=Halomonadaceae TaxID=28256 RepID=UPI000C31C6BE|nr:ABC transporter substrate-binding protein [Halomonas sp. MES3-P3E]PKG54963.1 ABC transporter substrate-binding protein [Halomonas sp. MES3-P3E]|tara:strand:- start:289 stop:1305 length:1017 start_codon:yes stop_codon:yes gene_type:complete